MELPKAKRVRTVKPTPDKSLYERLPLKRRLFVDYYLGKANGCKTKAARMAGYAGPANEGYRLCNDPDVWAYIQDRLKASAMSADEVIARLGDHARATVEDFIDVLPPSDAPAADTYREGDPCPVCAVDRPDAGQVLVKVSVTDPKSGRVSPELICAVCGDRWKPEPQVPWRLNLAKAEDLGKLHLLTELGWTETGPKFKLVDQQAALGQLGRYHGLFTDKTEGRLKVVSPYEGMTDDELEERARQLRGKTGTAGGDPAPGGTGTPES